MDLIIRTIIWIIVLSLCMSPVWGFAVYAWLRHKDDPWRREPIPETTKQRHRRLNQEALEAFERELT